MDNINQYSSSSARPNKSSSIGDEPQLSDFHPYDYEDFVNDAIDFQKSYIPGAKSYYGLMNDPNYGFYDAMEDLNKDVVPFYNLYKEGSTNPVDYILEGALLASPYGKKLLAKFDNKVNDVRKYLLGDNNKMTTVTGVTQPEQTVIEARLNQAKEESNQLQELLKEVQQYNKAMKSAEQQVKKLNKLDNKINNLSQKSNVLNKFEQSAGDDYNYFVNDNGDYFIKSNDGVPYRIVGERAIEDKFAGRTPIKVRGVQYNPQPNLYPMVDNVDDTFYKPSVGKHLKDRPYVLDPRISKSIADKERFIGKGKLNALIDTEGSLYDVPYYNEPEDYSRIMRILKK